MHRQVRQQDRAYSRLQFLRAIRNCRPTILLLLDADAPDAVYAHPPYPVHAIIQIAAVNWRIETRSSVPWIGDSDSVSCRITLDLFFHEYPLCHIAFYYPQFCNITGKGMKYLIPI